MKKQSNVIDMSQHRTKNGQEVEVGSLNLKLDTDQLRAAIAMALLSVVFLVTVTNNSLLSSEDVKVGVGNFSSRIPASERTSNRAVASVPTGTSDWEDQMVSRLSKLSVSENLQVGRRPSSLERLTLEFLEGKYSVRLENGKIRELSFSDSSQSGDRPKYVLDRTAFLDQNRDLLPVSFSESKRAGIKTNELEVIESYDLVDKSSATVAKVEFHMDKSGRLISMKID